MIKEKILTAFRILASPQKEFQGLKNRTLESVVSQHVIMLLLSALLAFISVMLFYFGRAIYYSAFYGAEILYTRVLNYSFGIGIAMFYFFLFAGTFLLFFFSLIIKVFARNRKYTELLKVILYSVTPLVIFGWIPITPYSMILWSIILLAIGTRVKYNPKE